MIVLTFFKEIFLFAILGLFFIYFRLCKQALQFLQQIYVKNDMSIQYMAPGFEPITTRPGLLPQCFDFINVMYLLHSLVIIKIQIGN